MIPATLTINWRNSRMALEILYFLKTDRLAVFFFFFLQHHAQC